jgi:hypothetical protein
LNGADEDHCGDVTLSASELSRQSREKIRFSEFRKSDDRAKFDSLEKRPKATGTETVDFQKPRRRT